MPRETQLSSVLNPGLRSRQLSLHRQLYLKLQPSNRNHTEKFIWGSLQMWKVNVCVCVRASVCVCVFVWMCAWFRVYVCVLAWVSVCFSGFLPSFLQTLQALFELIASNQKGWQRKALIGSNHSIITCQSVSLPLTLPPSIPLSIAVGWCMGPVSAGINGCCLF